MRLRIQHINSFLNISLLLLFVLCFAIGQNSIAQSNLEEALRADIEDQKLDKFSHIQAAFILSGATEPDSLQFYLDWYHTLVEKIESFGFDPFHRVQSAEKVFGYLHATWLVHYQKEATTLLSVVNRKTYNCVSGTILFNLICEDLGWDTEAFETPTHTYTIFSTFTDPVKVENTTSLGFDIMKNLKKYSTYLLQFYPRQKALNIGLDKLYAYENSKGRRINNTELLGLLAYNRAYFAKQKKDFEKAYQFVLLAQKFNRDSRSNINFEIDLYNQWGKKLFDEGNFIRAFHLFTDACYRYSDIKAFAQNCKVAFFRAQKKLWQNKNWQISHNVISDIYQLGVLTENESNQITKILSNWAIYFTRIQRRAALKQVISLWQQINPTDPKLDDFRSTF